VPQVPSAGDASGIKATVQAKMYLLSELGNCELSMDKFSR